VTSDASGFDVHDHVAWCGDGSRALHRVAVAAFGEALTRHERLLFVCDEPNLSWLAELGDIDGLIARQTLQVDSVDETYTQFEDTQAQLARFEGTLEQALVDGYTGICVVADNSRLVGETDEDFARWLRWEATADWLQANRPVNGICFFDRQHVSDERLADLAAMHPVRSAEFGTPNFRLFYDADDVRLTGEVDALFAGQLVRLLSSFPGRVGREVDLTGLSFIDHRALLRLNEYARDCAPMRLRGAPSLMRRIWDLLDVATPALEFC